MACVDEIFLNDVGTSLEFLIKECNNNDPDNPVEELVNISFTTDMVLTFLKPDSTTLVVTNPQVKFLTDGTDSLIHYLTEVGDLDIAGNWKAQLRITMPTGIWYTSKISFKVLEHL